MKLLNAFIVSTVFATTLSVTVLSKAAVATEIITPRTSAVKILERKAAPIRIVEPPAKTLIPVDRHFEQRLIKPAIRVNEPVTVNNNVVEPVVSSPWLGPIDWATPIYTPEPLVQVNVHPATPVVWQNKYVLNNSAGWAGLMMPVDQSGHELVLNVQNGETQISALEVYFNNGQVEQINLQDQSFGNGTYSLVNFGGQRYVNSIKLVARSQSPQTNLTVRLQ